MGGPLDTRCKVETGRIIPYPDVRAHIHAQSGDLEKGSCVAPSVFPVDISCFLSCVPPQPVPRTLGTKFWVVGKGWGALKPSKRKRGGGGVPDNVPSLGYSKSDGGALRRQAKAKAPSRPQLSHSSTSDRAASSSDDSTDWSSSEDEDMATLARGRLIVLSLLEHVSER